MPRPRLACQAEDVPDWHPRLFLEPHVIAAVAVLAQSSSSPASIDVQCERIESGWLGETDRFVLEMGWSALTAAKAERLRLTVQAKPLVEMAATALAFALVRHVVDLGQLDVTEYGGRADYRSLSLPACCP